LVHGGKQRASHEPLWPRSPLSRPRNARRTRNEKDFFIRNIASSAGLRLVRVHAGRHRMATVRLDRSGTAGNSREYQDGAEYG
jgi:hypothetical protein